MKYCVTYEYWGSLENKYINIKTAAIKPLKGVIAAVFKVIGQKVCVTNPNKLENL